MVNEPNTQPLEQEEWLDEEPRARGGIPGWAKFCGCGCLLVIGLLVTLVIVVGGKVRSGFDEELQWQKLDAALHYDLRPESLTPVFGWEWITPFILLNDERGYMWIVRIQGEEGPRYREAIFGDNAEYPDPILNFKSVGGEVSDLVEVQGRELRTKRFFQSGAPILEAMTGQGKSVDGQSILVDVSPEGSEGMVVLFLVEVDAEDPISDEELQELLAPFHVGPERVTYVPPPAAEDDEAAPPEEEDR